MYGMPYRVTFAAICIRCFLYMYQVRFGTIFTSCYMNQVVFVTICIYSSNVPSKVCCNLHTQLDESNKVCDNLYTQLHESSKVRSICIRS